MCRPRLSFLKNLLEHCGQMNFFSLSSLCIAATWQLRFYFCWNFSLQWLHEKRISCIGFSTKSKFRLLSLWLFFLWRSRCDRFEKCKSHSSHWIWVLVTCFTLLCSDSDLLDENWALHDGQPSFTLSWFSLKWLAKSLLFAYRLPHFPQMNLWSFLSTPVACANS